LCEKVFAGPGFAFEARQVQARGGDFNLQHEALEC